MMKFRNHIVITLQILTVVKSQLTVRTGYIEVEGTGATFDCSIGNQSFDSSFTRQWKAPINQNNLVLVINGGNTVVSGYDESLMNATIGFISMTTPRLEWTVENKKFECSYGFSVHSINATHDILATEGTYKFTDDADKCEIEWKNVLPLPSTVAVTNIKGSAETDISNVQGKVLTTSKNNSDQGRTHDFTLTIQKTDLEADSVRIQVVAGPYTKTETCNLTGYNLIVTIVLIVILDLLMLLTHMISTITGLVEPVKLGKVAALIISPALGVTMIVTGILIALFGDKAVVGGQGIAPISTAVSVAVYAVTILILSIFLTPKVEGWQKVLLIVIAVIIFPFGLGLGIGLLIFGRPASDKDGRMELDEEKPIKPSNQQNNQSC